MKGRVLDPLTPPDMDLMICCMWPCLLHSDFLATTLKIDKSFMEISAVCNATLPVSAVDVSCCLFSVNKSLVLRSFAIPETLTPQPAPSGDECLVTIVVSNSISILTSYLDSLVRSSTDVINTTTTRQTGTPIGSARCVSPCARVRLPMFGVRAVCGNSLCEFGEACTTANCSTGCALDCPAYSGHTCPLGVSSSSGQLSECSSRGTCLQASGTCSCNAGYTGAACSHCLLNYTRLTQDGPCILFPGALTSCDDGVKNGNEDEVDCGGPNCAPCVPAPTSQLIMIASVTAGALTVLGVALAALKRYLASSRTMVVTASLPKARDSDFVSKLRSLRSAKSGIPARSGNKVTPIAVTPQPVKQRNSVIQWLRHHSTAGLEGTGAGNPAYQAQAPRNPAVSSGNLLVDWSQYERKRTSAQSST